MSTNMEADDTQDVSMHDNDNENEVVETTEAYASRLAQSAAGIPINGSQPRHYHTGSTVLKGSGLRRELIFENQLIERKDGPKPAKFESLPYATSQTGLVYDVRMRFHVDAEPTSEDDLHPEDPRRIHAIFEAFVNAGLAWRQGDSGPVSSHYMGRIDARMVTQDEVMLVHTLDHWNWVQSLKDLTGEQLDCERQHPVHALDSIYLSNSTPYCAALSAGGAIEACRAVLLEKVKNVFAVIRPPGHHAEREDAKGFCFYDNVSIASKVCQAEFKDQCRKVFILDWDVHHGNGIQQANYDDPNVLYISLHVHKRGGFYPEHSYRDNRVAYGDHLHCGAGPGLGKNVNVPWSKQGMGDADYIYAFQQIVMPIATEFDPDLVIIAAGFDAAEGDMLGGCEVTPAGYAHMTHMLMSLAKGKMAVCLEGGYNLDSIARSATAVARTMMGEPPDRLENVEPTISGVDDVKRVLRQQSRFWSCLYPKDLSIAGSAHGEGMDSVVRGWQAKTLFEEYSMTPLFVHRENLAKEFKDQVLATPNYAEARPLLVILHDPPEVLASPDPRTGKLELHNTWLTDAVKSYIDSAVKHGFAVIDVNLPKHVSNDDDSDEQEHHENDDVDFRIRQATVLLTYLWENYIELNDNTHVFLMGTNTGHGAIINFIKNHEERALQTVTQAISFIKDVSLMSCKSLVGSDLLPSWYYANSLVFVTQEHSYFSSDFARKPKKRFGAVYKSESTSISDMLTEHREQVIRCLLRETEDWDPEKASDEMEISAPSPLPTSPKRKPQLPPIGNFAFSPTRGLMAASTSMPSGANSPKPPPFSSFAASSRE